MYHHFITDLAKTRSHEAFHVITIYKEIHNPSAATAALKQSSPRLFNTIIDVNWRRRNVGRPEGWRGYMTELLRTLGDQVPLEAKRGRDWPANARWFSDRLERAKPGLRSIGISCTERRDSRGVRLTIEWVAAPATFATEAVAHSEFDLETEARTDAAGAASAVSPARASDATGPESAANAAGAAIVQPSEGLQAKPWRMRL